MKYIKKAIKFSLGLCLIGIAYIGFTIMPAVTWNPGTWLVSGFLLTAYVFSFSFGLNLICEAVKRG